MFCPLNTAWSTSLVDPSEIAANETFLCPRTDLTQPWILTLPSLSVAPASEGRESGAAELALPLALAAWVVEVVVGEVEVSAVGAAAAAFLARIARTVGGRGESRGGQGRMMAACRGRAERMKQACEQL